MKKTLPFLLLGRTRACRMTVVSLEGITAGKAWKKEPLVVLDQQKCEYVPHVLIAPLGSQLEILNSDAVMRNVHTYELSGELKTLFTLRSHPGTPHKAHDGQARLPGRHLRRGPPMDERLHPHRGASVRGPDGPGRQLRAG